jgi:hypothetical protein
MRNMVNWLILAVLIVVVGIVILLLVTGVGCGTDGVEQGIA